jgi:hypothetical protein
MVEPPPASGRLPLRLLDRPTVSGVRPEVECFPLPELQLQAGQVRAGLAQAQLLPAPICTVCSGHGAVPRPRRGDGRRHHPLLRAARRVPDHQGLEAALARHRQLLGLPLPASAPTSTCWSISSPTSEPRCGSKHRNEQEFLSGLPARSRASCTYWPKAWCASFKYHCLPRWPVSFWKEASIPEGCRIAVFHGEVNPPDAIAGRRNRFGRGMVPARWVAEHWTE